MIASMIDISSRISSLFRMRRLFAGRRFGKWILVNRDANSRWWCQCDCGSPIRSVQTSGLTSGRSKSCGCMSRNRLLGTRICGAWNGMKIRCLYPSQKGYPDYGGRGITICNFLMRSPEGLLNTIGDHPGDGFTIDRIDNDMHYSCGSCPQCLKNKWLMNVRWATRTQQARNKRSNRRVTIKGVTKSMAEWAEDLGMSYSALKDRLRRGWSDTDLLLPVGSRRYH